MPRATSAVGSVRYPIIAVFDSGVGGLTILASLAKRMPAAQYVYYGDTANAPYGPRSAEEIFRLSCAAIEKLLAYTPDVIVLACNTVTSTSITKLRAKYPGTEFVGVEPAVKPAVIVTKKKKIIVAATAATLASDSYQELKKTWAVGVEVIELPKPEWVKMIEDSTVNEEILQVDAKEIETIGTDVLVLACTHFPFLRKKLQGLLPNIMIIDSADPVANRVWRVLGEPNNETNDAPKIIWIFSDPERPNEPTREHVWTVAQTIG